MVEALLVIRFYVLMALLVIRMRRASLALARLVLTGMLVLALVAQATISSRIGGYAALGLVVAVVMFGLAAQLERGRAMTKVRRPSCRALLL